MYGFTTSQSIEIVVLIVSIIMYYCVNYYSQQNAWSFVFAVALLCLIVGIYDVMIDMLFMKDSTFDYEPHYENWQRKQ